MLGLYSCPFATSGDFSGRAGLAAVTMENDGFLSRLIQQPLPKQWALCTI